MLSKHFASVLVDETFSKSQNKVFGQRQLMQILLSQSQQSPHVKKIQKLTLKNGRKRLKNSLSLPDLDEFRLLTKTKYFDLKAR